jgi:hypothetical protein
MERDPNGIAAAVTALVVLIAGVVDVSVDEEVVAQVGFGIAGVVSIAAIIVARLKAWAPDSVRALKPGDVPDVASLPPVPSQAALTVVRRSRQD